MLLLVDKDFSKQIIPVLFLTVIVEDLLQILPIL
jgi:hypothetical protein